MISTCCCLGRFVSSASDTAEADVPEEEQAEQDVQEEEISKEIIFWNWLRPYEFRVWVATVATIVFSGLVYQLIEYLQDERDERTHWEWWAENWYLSMINSTQAYEYGTPKSFAAKLFGISMAVWALYVKKKSANEAHFCACMIDVLTSIFFC